MKVNVLFFASLKEDLGCAEIELQLSELASRADLIDCLTNELGSDRVASLFAENVSIAINQSIEKGEFTLQSGDEVAFLPPITGG